VAFVALKPGATANPQELAAFVEPHIPERPAVPKRIDIVAALPMTAIGKVYKPALRAIATQRVLQQRLRDIGLDDRVDVQVVETAAGLRARFRARQGVSPDTVEPRIRQSMSVLAIAYDVAAADMGSR
jgi:fatty-acyl-CoA synthase